MSDPVCSGFGAYDVRSTVTARGQVNNHIKAGLPYELVSADQLYTMAANPPTVDKDKAQWIIPSSYNYFDGGRSHKMQTDNGRFQYLAVDVDKGNKDMLSVIHAVQDVIGRGWEFLVYSTRGAKPDNRKWRVLIPLKYEIEGKNYGSVQEALFDLLGHRGIECDRTLSRRGQLVYLPNRGEYYESWTGMSSHLLDVADHAQLMELAQAKYTEWLDTKSGGGVGSSKDRGVNVIGTFNRAYETEDLMEKYGYTFGGKEWSSPYQQAGSGGHATMVRADGSWVSQSDSDDAANLGKKAASGARYGDAFDLFAHFEADGNMVLAVKKGRDLTQYGAATIGHGQELISAYFVAEDALQRATAMAMRAEHEAEDAARAAELAAAFSVSGIAEDGNNSDWALDWPPGLTGDIARWIYLSSSRPIKQFSIAAAIYIMTGAARKYSVSGSSLNLYMMLIAGTGRGKGVVKRAVDRLMSDVVGHTQNPNLRTAFSYGVPVSEAGFGAMFNEQPVVSAYMEELGAHLLPILKDTASSNDQGIRKALTMYYDSNEFNASAKRSASSKENTKDAVHMPTFSLCGDTQPNTFRAMLGSGTIDSGFAPRMLPFFFYGARSYHNEDSDNHTAPPKLVVERLSAIMQYAMATNEVVVPVVIAEAAKDLDRTLDRFTTDKINLNEPGAEIYNRAVVNTRRIAGLLAVGVNHTAPVISAEVYELAKAYVMQGVKEEFRLLNTGGTGSGENIRIYHIKEAAKAFANINPDTKHRTYKVPKAVIDDALTMTDKYFLVKFSGHSDFGSSSGSNTTQDNIRRAIAEAVSQDILVDHIPLGVRANTRQKFYCLGSGA